MEIQKKIMLIGCGKMGQAIAYDLVKHYQDLSVLVLVDKSPGHLNLLMEQLLLLKPNGLTIQKQILELKEDSEWDFLNKILQPSTTNPPIDLIISAAHYSINYKLTELACQNHIHMCDLGGNNSVVNQQKNLNEFAERQNIAILPDLGLAPGLANWIASYGIKKFESKIGRIDHVKIRVGGLPQVPIEPLNYQLVFSAAGLINEYVEKCSIIRDGKLEEVEPLTDIENMFMMRALESAHTSGGASSLPEKYQGKIKNLDYKTIRYPGHFQVFHAMNYLGLLDNPIIRPELEKAIETNLNYNNADMVLVRVSIQETHNIHLYEIADYYDQKTNHTAMMRATAYPVSIVAQMIMNGEIKETGVLSGDDVIPMDLMMDELEKRGIEIIQREFKNSHFLHEF